MADVVQFKLERMLNELDDLEKRGLFSRQEIAEIVKQKRKFEYRLKRPSPLKQDFLAYIDYEIQLDELRRLRKKALFKKSGGKKLKKSVSDYSGVTRIIDIYRLATTRFKGDIALWFQYLEFCKARGHGRLRKALAQLVRFHPKVPGVWIYAAAWEFDGNLNVAAARALMQNGLRACPTSEDLWVEYLRMELTYLNKLKARKIALGEDDGKNLPDNQKSMDEKQWRAENTELFMALDEEGDADGRSVHQDGESDGKLEVFREHGLNLLQTVYNSAIEALPSSFSLRTRFLEILESTLLSHSEDMQKKILDDMRRDFLNDPNYWDWLARIQIGELTGINSDKLSKAVQVYDEALKFVPTAMMIELYVKFLMDAGGDELSTGDAGNSSESYGHTIDLVSHFQMLFEKAESLGCITEDLACQHASSLLRVGKLTEAKILMENLCSKQLTNAVNLCTLWLSTELAYIQKNTLSPSKADLQKISQLLNNILTRFTISEAENIWIMGLKYFSSRKHYFDKLVGLALSLSLEHGASDDGFSLSSTIVNHVLQRDGVGSAREMYKRFIVLPRPGLAIYKNCIELELNLASTGNKDGLPNARKLYESAVAAYKENASLWQGFYSMEVKMGTSEDAASVHWRAMKALKGSFTPQATTDS